MCLTADCCNFVNIGLQTDCNLIDPCADDESVKGRICTSSSSPQHRILSWVLKIQRHDPAQMWSMGSSYGTIHGEEVRNIPLAKTSFLMIFNQMWTSKVGIYCTSTSMHRLDCSELVILTFPW